MPILLSIIADGLWHDHYGIHPQQFETRQMLRHVKRF